MLTSFGAKYFRGAHWACSIRRGAAGCPGAAERRMRSRRADRVKCLAVLLSCASLRSPRTAPPRRFRPDAGAEGAAAPGGVPTTKWTAAR